MSTPNSSPTTLEEYTAYYDLGTLQFPITTTNSESQTWFNYGWTWCIAFNHEEGVICFQNALAADPDCVMAFWGVAYAKGPNYNIPWEALLGPGYDSLVSEITNAVSEAEKRLDGVTDVEKALVNALKSRYPKEQMDKKDFKIWNEEYASAMESVYEDFKDDLNVVTLYTESLMNLNPWNLWNLKTGKPTDGADTLKIQSILESHISSPAGSDQIGLLHLYIHTMEMSPIPSLAVDASNNLLSLVRDLPHLIHMPSHIYIQNGDYAGAIHSNQLAVLADEKYLRKSGNLPYNSIYRCHDFHFLGWAAMFAGNSKVALEAAKGIERCFPREFLNVPPLADWLEAFLSLRVHVYVRFGKWDELIALPLPTDTKIYCFNTAITHYGHGIAYAVLKHTELADEAFRQFEEAVKLVGETRNMMNNKCSDILNVAREMLKGEIEYRKGNVDVAFEALRNAIGLEDHLPYDEPWGWMQPTRHALGALTLEQGNFAEALEIYKADLGLNDTLPRAQRHLNNVWSLHGYHECLVKLRREGPEVDEAKDLLDEALKGADIEIGSSCFCKIGGQVGKEEGHCC